jgi:hypothetical protein
LDINTFKIAYKNGIFRVRNAGWSSLTSIPAERRSFKFHCMAFAFWAFLAVVVVVIQAAPVVEVEPWNVEASTECPVCPVLSQVF